MKDAGIYSNYIEKLRKTQFSGELADDLATRLVLSTDNSIYQKVPDAVIFPKNISDIQIAVKLALLPEFKEVEFAVRGCGTSPNGQSLNNGVLIDTSKYMNQLIEIDSKNQTATIQPGIVRDTLNKKCRSHGLFFSPHVATTSRATVGGMINTDACGQGSRVYGRTSQNLISLKVVLMNGELLETKPMPGQSVKNESQKVLELLKEHQDEIHKIFPKIPRGLTGYNLYNAYEKDSDTLNLNYLFSGAEGTLGVVAEATVLLTPIPKQKRLAVFGYSSFEDAIDYSQTLLKHDPIAIEVINETVINGAKEMHCPPKVGAFLSENSVVQAMALVETETDLDEPNALTRITVTEQQDITDFWDLRKNGVGYVSNIPGKRKPIPFVEDTVVPPEKLTDFIKDFRNILDGYGLKYGMYGHSDVGCIHVRPALNLKDPEDEKLVQIISDKVYKLVKAYGGMMWGEHGKGYRTEYAPDTFGPILFPLLGKIKSVFDPKNKLNPGKIAAPDGDAKKIKHITEDIRARNERNIDEKNINKFEAAFNCNGNGACFSVNEDEAMCPSFKITRDKKHSPKGRAVLLKEWSKNSHPASFTKEVYEALKGCLSCKACTTTCPLKVDIPSYKASFLNDYYKQHKRPLSHLVIKNLEKLGVIQSKWPILSKLIYPVQLISSPLLGLSDTPKAIPTKPQRQPSFEAWAKQKSEKKVVLIQDIFTSLYAPQTLKSTVSFLKYQGFDVWVHPLFENGKPLHILGYISEFNQLVKKNIQLLNKLAENKIPLVGIEPSTTLVYREEYPKHSDLAINYKVFMLQEFLSTQPLKVIKKEIRKPIKLFLHCSEYASDPQFATQWEKVFEKVGATVEFEKTGCCGMAGIYGYQKENALNSKGIFDLSWKDKLTNEDAVTGFSCQHQVHRLLNTQTAKHPIEYIV